MIRFASLTKRYGPLTAVDELFIVLAGSCTMSTGSLEEIALVQRDSVALAAGKEYGFSVGDDGLEFIVVRPGDAQSSYA